MTSDEMIVILVDMNTRLGYPPIPQADIDELKKTLDEEVGIQDIYYAGLRFQAQTIIRESIVKPLVFKMVNDELCKKALRRFRKDWTKDQERICWNRKRRRKHL